MAKEKPADDAASRVKGRNNFGSGAIESAAQEYALILTSELGEIAARNQMSVGLEPTDQRIAFGVLRLVRFGQRPKSGAKPIAVAVANSRENSHPCHPRRVCHLFHNIIEERLDVLETTKHPRETQHRKRWGIDSFRRTLRMALPIRHRGLSWSVAQFSIRLHEVQIIKRPAD